MLFLTCHQLNFFGLRNLFEFQTLGEATSYGGVMLFITDGEFDCPSGGTELTDPVLQQEIIDSGVRIVTIAFR